MKISYHPGREHNAALTVRAFAGLSLEYGVGALVLSLASLKCVYAGSLSFDVPLRPSFKPNLFERFPATPPDQARQRRNRAYPRPKRVGERGLRKRSADEAILRFEGQAWLVYQVSTHSALGSACTYY